MYGGFIVQAAALGTLFVLYARDRWSHLWAGRIGDLAPDLTGRATRVTAVAASVLTLVPAALHLLWASGSERGLSAGRIADRTSDFYVLEAVRVVFVAAAVAGVLMLVLRLGKSRRVATPLALAWVGNDRARPGTDGGVMEHVTVPSSQAPATGIPSDVPGAGPNAGAATAPAVPVNDIPQTPGVSNPAPSSAAPAAPAAPAPAAPAPATK